MVLLLMGGGVVMFNFGLVQVLSANYMSDSKYIVKL